jgi:hypothetical protein
LLAFENCKVRIKGIFLRCYLFTDSTFHKDILEVAGKKEYMKMTKVH